MAPYDLTILLLESLLLFANYSTVTSPFMVLIREKERKRITKKKHERFQSHENLFYF